MKKSSVLGVILMILLLFISCSKVAEQPLNSEENQNSDNSKDLSDQTIFYIDDKEVREDEVFLYMQPIKEREEALYGKDVWDYKLNEDGMTYEKAMKEKIMDDIKYVKIVSLRAEELGIFLDEDELLDVGVDTGDFLSKFSQEEIKKYNINEETVRQIYMDNLLALKVYETLTLNVNTEIPEVEVRNMILQYVMLEKSEEDANGKQVDFTEEELDKLREKGKTFIRKVRKENVSDLTELKIDPYVVIELIADKQELITKLSKDIAEIAYQLEQGEVSDLLETDSAYFILFCAEETDRKSTENAKLEIIEKRQQELFEETYISWEGDTSIVVNQECWDVLNFR